MFVLFSATLICYHIQSSLSTTFLFLFRLFFTNERRRRDLNPRAAINDLHPFQGCPFGQLGYFSELKQYMIIDSVDNGESGIRTHAPLRTNGFQDRLVMTTSIPLQVIYVYVFFSTNKIISFLHLRVNSFFQISLLL